MTTRLVQLSMWDASAPAEDPADVDDFDPAAVPRPRTRRDCAGDPLDVACPVEHCAAAVGEPCKIPETPWDEWAALKGHAPRRELARAALRPCPFISCRFHLLVELTAPNGDHAEAGYDAGGQYRHDAVARPQPSMTLNRARPGQPPPLGRPPTLAPDASKREVAAFVDAAVAQLEVMPESCVLDVADRGPQSQEAVAAVLGLSVEAVIDAEAEAGAQLRGRSYEAGAPPPRTAPRTLARLTGETSEDAIKRAREWVWWAMVADREPEPSEGRWTWTIVMADGAEAVRLAAEHINRVEQE